MHRWCVEALIKDLDFAESSFSPLIEWFPANFLSATHPTQQVEAPPVSRDNDKVIHKQVI